MRVRRINEKEYKLMQKIRLTLKINIIKKKLTKENKIITN